jgi:hypothetical protein
VVAVSALGVVAVRDPAQPGSYGFCPLRALTGLDCPFCGGLRGTHDLLHGQLGSTLDHNLLLPLYLAVGLFLVVVASRQSSAARFSQWSRGRGRIVIWVLFAVVLGFFVVRNLPWLPYLDSQV